MPLSGFLCVSVCTSGCLVCLCSVPQLHLPCIRCPSPGFLSPDLALRRRKPLVPAGANRARRPPAGPARRQDEEGGRRGQRRGVGRAGARETGAWGTPLRPSSPLPRPEALGKGRRREVCAEFRGAPQEEAGAEFAPALRTGESSKSCLGGHPEGRCGGGARGGRRHLGPGEQCTPQHGAAVPMRVPTALGTYALHCSPPGPAPAPCPSIAPRGL